MSSVADFQSVKRDMADAIGEESLDQALALVIVGDHGGVAGVRRIDESRDSAGLSVIAQHHGSQIEPHPVWRREFGPQLAVNFDLFLDELQVVRVKFGALLDQRRRHRHRPERRNARER